MTLSGSRILHQLLAGCVRVIAQSEVSLKRSLLPNESEIRWEIPAPPVIHRSASLPHPDKSAYRICQIPSFRESRLSGGIWIYASFGHIR